MQPTPATRQYRDSVFSVPKMDCPSEENLIRMTLDPAQVQAMSFDLAARQLRVTHEGDAEALLRRLAPLNLGATLLASEPSTGGAATVPAADDAAEAGP